MLCSRYIQQDKLGGILYKDSIRSNTVIMDGKDSICSLMCQSKSVTNNIASGSHVKEVIPSRVVVRVKRRRSRSPAEALLLTENISNIKRAKKGDASDCATNEHGSNAKLKVFRFTATLNDCKREEETEELVTKMLEKTNKEIKEAKRQKCPNSTPDRRAIKSIKNGHSSVRYSTEPAHKNHDYSVEKSVEARYHIVQSKRDNITGLSEDHRNKGENGEESVANDKSKFYKPQDSADNEKHKDDHMIKQELENFCQFYDLEIEDTNSKLKSHPNKDVAHGDTAISNREEDVITCNGVQSQEIKPDNKDYVYDLYCHIDDSQTYVHNSKESTKLVQNASEFAFKSQRNEQENVNDMAPLPDFQSTFGDVVTNIIGCDWKSAQNYLTSDLSNDGMPAWWHRGGEINSDIEIEASDDSNEEDNWRNDYPDEVDDDVYGYDEGNIDKEIYGLDGLQMDDYGNRSDNSDENDDRLLYTIEDNSEFNNISNRHGLAYASYKRKMQRYLGEINDDDDELDKDSSDEDSDKDF